MKNSKNKKIDYWKVDDGLGGSYERIAYSNIVEKLAKKYKAKKILELNSTFIAGVPGFNSGILAQHGFDVTITVHSRDYKDALEVWDIVGLKNKVKIIEWNNDFETKFRDNQFDMVWNHLAFEHYQNPSPLIKEMKRISNNLILNLTLSPFNLGFPIHWLIHKISRKPWDHGFFKNMLISTMDKVHKSEGLKLVESGGCDVPPWMDTVDLEMGGSMRYFDAWPKSIADKWVWGATNPDVQNHPVIKLLWDWEVSMPEWFRRLVAHHLYTCSKKDKKK